MYHDLGNVIHFLFHTMQFFPLSQEDTVSKDNEVSFPQREKQNFFGTTIKNNFNMYVSSFIWIVYLVAECILKEYTTTI